MSGIGPKAGNALYVRNIDVGSSNELREIPNCPRLKISN